MPLMVCWGGGGESLGSFEEMAQKEKVIVTVDKLLQLFGGPCDAKDCGRQKCGTSAKEGW